MVDPEEHLCATHTAYANPTQIALSLPATVVDALHTRMGDLERLVWGGECQSFEFWDLCYFPEAVLPSSFCIPDFVKYNRKGCPISHLWAYREDLTQLQADDRLLIRLFQKSLTGPALKWFTSLDMTTIRTWSGLTQAFLEQYSFNLDLIPKREDLVTTGQRPNKPFGEHVSR